MTTLAHNATNVKDEILNRLDLMTEAEQVKLLQVADQVLQDGVRYDLMPSDEEVQQALTFTPKSGAEIIAEGLVGGWESKGIEDSVAWVSEQRAQRRKNRANVSED